MNRFENRHSWIIPSYQDLSQFPFHDLPTALKATLARRGLNELNLLEPFFYKDSLPDPYSHLPDLNKAIKRINDSINKKEKIAVCGDYDADGMTSSALLIRALTKVKAYCKGFIPNRFDQGYGLNKEMIKKLKSNNYSLIITVDNGVAANEALTYANNIGIDVIVTDHHKIPKDNVSPYALIHTELTPKKSPYKYLAGVGLAYILGYELLTKTQENKDTTDLLDLFCIGTIADMAPLKGANRIILKKGLSKIQNTKIEGLKSVIKLSGLEGKEISSDDIGFKIAPRINSVGRIDDPLKILDLLTTKDIKYCMSLANECEDINKRRKILAEGIIFEAIAILESDIKNIPPIIILAQKHWHIGVIGLVAAKITERFNRPTAILGESKEGIFTGSVRSINGFSVIKLLNYCHKHLESYGGHEYAGGFKVKYENFGKFSDEVYNYSIKQKTDISTYKSIRPDANLKFNDISIKFYEKLKELGPFGVSNPQPLFWANDCSIIRHKKLKSGYNSFIFSQNDIQFKAICWDKEKLLFNGSTVDIAFHLILNNWNKKDSLELEIVSIRESFKKKTLKKGENKYEAFIDDNEVVTITNSRNEKLTGHLNQEGHIVINKMADNKYVLSLFEESLIMLGILA